MQISSRFLTILSVVIGLGFFWPASPVKAETRSITFPVLGATSYSNDWHAPRSGHLHQGNDIFGRKLQPLVATATGTIRFVPYPEPSYGWMVSIADRDGYEYWYLHINNDTPGTDDGLADPRFAYAFGIRSGWPVVKGQLIGYMGDSGNAETTTPHVHFEIHRPDGEAINPFESLSAAQHIGTAAAAPIRSGEIRPFAGFQGGGRVATGDVDPATPGDEIVIVAGRGGGPQVRVYSKNRQLLSSFFVPIENFRGGLDVATGDINIDGTEEIIVGLGPGGPPQVFVFTLGGNLISQFMAYDPGFRGGINVAAADLDGDSRAEIITGPQAGGGPEVRVFSPTGTMRRSFFAYDPRFRGGIDVVGLSRIPGVQSSRIVTAPGPGGGPEIRIFGFDKIRIKAFFAFYQEFRGGLHVAIDDEDPDQPLILTTPMAGLQSFVHRHTFHAEMLDERLFLENWYLGGFDVAAANGRGYVITGPGRPVDLQSRSFRFGF